MEISFSQQSNDTNFSQESSQSSVPSPIHVKLGNFISEENFSDLKNEEKTRILNIIIPQLETLDGVVKSNVNKLAKLIGSFCHPELKNEAHFYRLKRSRDEVSFAPEEILEKQQNIEILHNFFESATQKSGRQPGENRAKIAAIQATFYESLLKGTNLCTVGPYNFSKTKKLLGHVQSKQLMEGNLGGSYTFHNKLTVTEPLPITRKGPLISDNAQKGKGKYQHHVMGKLDRSAPVNVVTHNIRVESVNDNQIFLDPKNAPPSF